MLKADLNVILYLNLPDKKFYVSIRKLADPGHKDANFYMEAAGFTANIVSERLDRRSAEMRKATFIMMYEFWGFTLFNL